MHICQSIVASLKAVCQPLVIHPQALQDGGIQVMNVDGVGFNVVDRKSTRLNSSH